MLGSSHAFTPDGNAKQRCRLPTKGLLLAILLVIARPSHAQMESDSLRITVCPAATFEVGFAMAQLPAPQGLPYVGVTYVHPHSPLSKTIEQNDAVTAVNGVATPSPEAFIRETSRLKPGDVVRLDVMRLDRNAQPLAKWSPATFKITLPQRPGVGAPSQRTSTKVPEKAGTLASPKRTPAGQAEISSAGAESDVRKNTIAARNKPNPTDDAGAETKKTTPEPAPSQDHSKEVSTGTRNTPDERLRRRDLLYTALPRIAVTDPTATAELSKPIDLMLLVSPDTVYVRSNWNSALVRLDNGTLTDVPEYLASPNWKWSQSLLRAARESKGKPLWASDDGKSIAWRRLIPSVAKAQFVLETIGENTKIGGAPFGDRAFAMRVVTLKNQRVVPVPPPAKVMAEWMDSEDYAWEVNSKRGPFSEEQMVAALKEGQVWITQHFAISPLERLLAVTFDRKVFLLDLELKTAKQLSGGLGGSLFFSGDGNRLVQSERKALHDDRDVLVWDVAHPAEPRRLPNPGGTNFTATAISHDGKVLCTTSSDSCSVWDLETGQIRASFVTGANQNTAITPDGRWVIAAGREFVERGVAPMAYIRMFDAMSGRKVIDWPNEDTPYYGVIVSEDGKWLAINSFKNLRIWDLPALIEQAVGLPPLPEGDGTEERPFLLQALQLYQEMQDEDRRGKYIEKWVAIYDYAVMSVDRGYNNPDGSHGIAVELSGPAGAEEAITCLMPIDRERHLRRLDDPAHPPIVGLVRLREREAGSSASVRLCECDVMATELDMDQYAIPTGNAGPITAAQYSQLKEGMLYDEVLRLFGGRGVEEWEDEGREVNGESGTGFGFEHVGRVTVKYVGQLPNEQAVLIFEGKSGPEMKLKAFTQRGLVRESP